VTAIAGGEYAWEAGLDAARWARFFPGREERNFRAGQEKALFVPRDGLG